MADGARMADDALIAPIGTVNGKTVEAGRPSPEALAGAAYASLAARPFTVRGPR
jgi:hypothetical protein